MVQGQADLFRFAVWYYRVIANWNGSSRQQVNKKLVVLCNSAVSSLLTNRTEAGVDCQAGHYERWVNSSQTFPRYGNCWYLVPPLSRREMFHWPPGCQYRPARRRLRADSATTKSNRTRRYAAQTIAIWRPTASVDDCASPIALVGRESFDHGLPMSSAGRRLHDARLLKRVAIGERVWQLCIDAVPAATKSKLRRKERH